MLAILSLFEKYHNFVYECKVVVQNDHRLLMATVNKLTYKISFKMQRVVLKLQKYDFKVNYIPYNEMFLADTLSHAFPINETMSNLKCVWIYLKVFWRTLIRHKQWLNTTEILK